MAKVSLDLSEYPSNSHKSKEEAERKKKADKPIVSVSVENKKPSFGRKFKEAFQLEDIRTVMSELWSETIKPAIKDGIADAATGFIEGILFGSTSARRRKKSGSYGQASYTAYYKSDGRSVRSGHDDRDEYASRGKIDFRDIDGLSRAEAEDILDTLVTYFDEYPEVTVADFLDLVDINPDPQDNHWGWTNLAKAKIRRGRNGYSIDFPPVEYLD